MDPADPAKRGALTRLQAEAATTPADLQHMLGRDTYPTWIHAAYADLAGRLARVEDLLEELGASMSLLHTKMETIIGQLAAYERQDRAD
jgi:hypothetical protein